jgi:phage host-nuclease inhibitor protein Gam
VPAEIGRFPGYCDHCGGRPELVIQVDFEPVLRRLANLERLVRKEGTLIMSDIHAEIAEQVQTVITALDAEDADLARELADFASVVAPHLTDDEKAQFGSLVQKLVDHTSEIDAVDAPPAPTA